MFRPAMPMFAVVLTLATTGSALAQAMPSEPGEGPGTLETVKRIHAPIDVTVLPPAGG